MNTDGRFLAGLLVAWTVMAGSLLWAAPGATPAEKARILLVTGVDYPGHLWRQTAPALAEALRQDPRLEVFTLEDPGVLDSTAINKYDLILLHFQNWEQPGPGERARENLRQFVEGSHGKLPVVSPEPQMKFILVLITIIERSNYTNAY